MPTKPVFFRNLREGRKALTELGIDPGFLSLKEMGVTYTQELKRRASAVKLPTSAVATIKTALSAIGDLKAAAKAEKDINRKCDLFSQLSQKLSAELAKEKDPFKSTEIQREFMQAQKQEAYALLALKTVDPAAFKARRYLDAANRE